MSKAMSFRLDDEVVAKLDYYAAATGKSKTKFIEDAISRECFYVKQQRSGGINLNIPNPNFIKLSETKKIETIKSIKELGNSLEIDLGLKQIRDWLEQRFVTDSDNFKNQLVNNFYQDINFENNIQDDMTFIKEGDK